MVKTQDLILCFEITVTPFNINLVKQLAGTSMIDEDPDEVELGDKIDVEFTLEGEFTPFAISMAMLFNSGITGKPILKVERNETN